MPSQNIIRTSTIAQKNNGPAMTAVMLWHTELAMITTAPCNIVAAARLSVTVVTRSTTSAGGAYITSSHTRMHACTATHFIQVTPKCCKHGSNILLTRPLLAVATLSATAVPAFACMTNLWSTATAQHLTNSTGMSHMACLHLDYPRPPPTQQRQQAVIPQGLV